VPRTFFVGDVHGCLGELEALLKRAGCADGDPLVLLGDLVAKGPDSQGVVQLLRERGARAVMGNHDAKVLEARKGRELKKTHAKVAASLTEADWQTLEALPPWLELQDLSAVAVHGGLDPSLPLAQQDEELVRNMRSLDAKGRPSKRIEGGVPWGSRWPGPAFVLFGHDAVRGLQQHAHAWGLDSGCVYGGRLTGCWLPEKQLVSVPAKRVWSEPEVE